MRFPNLFQSLCSLIFFFVLQIICKSIIKLPQYGTLKDLISYLIPALITLGSLALMNRKEVISIDSITIKKVRLDDLVLSVGIAIFCLFTPLLNQFSHFNKEIVNQTYESVLEVPVDIFVFFSMVIFAPIFEEIFFRGIIFSGLQKNYSTIWALIISSLLFGVLHVNIINSFILGLFWAWLYYKTNNITLCVISHSICNFLGFLLRAYVQDGKDTLGLDRGKDHSIIISITMLIIAGLLFFVLSKRLKNRIEEETVHTI